MKKITEYIGGIIGAALIIAMPLAVLSNCQPAHAQIVNPGAPTTAGTGLTKSGTALNVTYGTTSGTSTQGNDTRVTGAAQKSANLSDLLSASTARTNLGLGTAATAASTDFLSSASTVTVPQGGTGAVTNTNHGVLLGQGTSPIAATTAGSSGQPLISGGNSADPAYGNLGVASGGTGLTTIGADGILYGNGTSAIGVTGAGTVGQLLTSNGAGVAPTFQTIATGTGTVTSGLIGQLSYYPGSAALVSGNANANMSAGNLTLGVAGTTLGSLGLSGTTSGVVTIQPALVAGTYNFNLPTAAGTSGQALLSGGGGSTAQTYGTLGVAAGGTGAVTETSHGVLVGAGTSAFAATAAGTSGQPLLSGGASADPAYGTLAASFGGTGATTNTNHGVMLGQGTAAVVTTAAGTTGQALLSGGASADPSFGTLGANFGGTGATTLAAHGVVVGNGTTAVSVTGTGNTGDVLTSNGASADPTFQAPAAGTTYRATTTAQFDKTSDTTLAAVPGLTVTVPAGTYIVHAHLIISTTATPGFKSTIGGTRTVTSQSFTIRDNTDAVPTVMNQTTGTGANPTVSRTANTNTIDFDGVIVVSVTGTIIINFAQNVSSGTTASVLVNSYLMATAV